MNRSLILPIGVSSLAIVLVPILYLRSLHNSLGQVISHKEHCGVITESNPDEVQSIPPSAFQDKCLSVSDYAAKSVRRALLPSHDVDKLLTIYLRYTMHRFSGLPQARLIRLMTPAATRFTFLPTHISELEFVEKDVVCALYEVALRKPGRVEFAMKSPSSAVEGRLVCMVEEVGDEIVFSTRTVMWKGPEEKEVMPLEKGLVFWVHELTSWWLLDVGTRFLMALKETEKEDKEI